MAAAMPKGLVSLVDSFGSFENVGVDTGGNGCSLGALMGLYLLGDLELALPIAPINSLGGLVKLSNGRQLPNTEISFLMGLGRLL